ncbi:MAG: hypothetical protein WCI56_10325 [Hyphomicrobiales bacterium]
MKIPSVSVVLAFILVVAATYCAVAADYSRSPPRIGTIERSYEMPFPRSERAQSVWNSGVCWSECGANCAWGVAACLQRDAQGVCISKADTCDRYCLRLCRSPLTAGPLVPDYLDGILSGLQ